MSDEKLRLCEARCAELEKQIGILIEEAQTFDVIGRNEAYAEVDRLRARLAAAEDERDERIQKLVDAGKAIIAEIDKDWPAWRECDEHQRKILLTLETSLAAFEREREK